MQNIIITIGREYGSGGKYIGQKVSEKLNIPFYDKEIITKTYDKSGCNYSKLNNYDEIKKNSIIKALELFSTSNYEEAFDDTTITNLIDNTINELADSGSCIILGRNSNNVLKDRDNVINIFIYSNNLDFKIKRKMQLENINYDEALNNLKFIDKKRKEYYESINKKQIWGDKRNYDYLIDSSILGVDGTVDLIIDIYKKKKEINITYQ